MCGVCVFFPIYIISISLLCVLQEGHGLAKSNQQMYDFYKRVILEQKRHCGYL